MRDGWDDAAPAFDHLLGSAAAPIQPIDRVALLLLKAELLHLDCRDDEAVRILENEILREIPEAAPFSFIIRQNLSSVRFLSLSPDAGKDFYPLVDEKRLKKLQLIDTESLLEARSAAEAGKHYESLPMIWREMVRTYHQGCWQIHRRVASYLSRECIELGWGDEAAINTVNALDESSAKAAADHLLRSRNRERIHRTVDWILRNARLCRHMAVGCSILTVISDAIPDDMIPSLLAWTADERRNSELSHANRRVAGKAWELIQKVSPRLDSRHAAELVSLVSGHDWWQQFTLDREKFYQIVAYSFRSLPIRSKKRIAARVLRNVEQGIEQHDHGTAVGLLAYMASELDRPFVDLLGARLYRKGNRLSPALIIAAEPMGKKEAITPVVQRWLPRIIADVRNQVQWIEAGAEPRPVGETYFTYTKPFPDGRRLVVYFTGTTSLHAVVGYRWELERSSVETFIDAVLSAIESPENMLDNKSQLVRILGEAADFVVDTRPERAFDLLARLARGQFQESEHLMSAAEADSPLNPFKMRSGSPSVLRAIALQTLGQLEHERPHAFGKRLRQVLWEAMGCAERDVQVGACNAWGGIKDVPRSVQIHLLLATRSGNADVAATAFGVIAENTSIRPKGAEWDTLVGSLEIAAQSERSGVRRAAATAVRHLLDRSPSVAVRSKLERLHTAFQDDICWSVRRLATENNTQAR